MSDSTVLTKPTYTGALLALLAIAASYILPAIPVGIWVMPKVVADHGKISPSLMNQLVALSVEWQAVFYPIAFFGIYVFVKKNGGFEYFGIQRLKMSDLKVITIGILVMFVIVDGTSSIAEHFLPEQTTEAHMLLPTGASPFYVAVVFLVGAIMAPLAEEGAFRIVMMRTLLPRIGVAWSVGISSLLFGIMHFSLTNLVPLALGGIILSSVYLRTRNVWASVITHGVFNSVALTLTLAGVGG